MAAIEKLPDDLLCELFCLSSGSNIGAKFAVSQVSARWRAIALNSRVLWTRFALSKASHVFQLRFDFQRLPVVLARSGSRALLDVVITGPFSREETSRLAEILVPYTARIRVLEVAETALDTLLILNFEFSALDVLRIRDLNVPGGELRLAAPALRVLDLDKVTLRRIDGLLSPSITSVTINRGGGIGYESLRPVLSLCPNLVHFAYRPRWTPRLLPSAAPFSHITPLRMLQTLDLHLSYAQIINLLNVAIDRRSSPRIVKVLTSVDPTHDAQEIQQLCTLLLRGTAPLILLDRAKEQWLTLQDAVGRERTFTIWVRNWTLSSVHVWRLLADHHGAQDTVHDIAICVDSWDELAADFATHPPRACQTLRIRDDWEWDASSESDEALPTLQALVLPGLRRVEFCDLGTIERPLVPFVLLILRSITCDVHRTIEVAIDPPIGPMEEIRELLDSDEGGRWKLVT